MRLITWNVNSLRARLPRVQELLAAHEPDVVCLQETKVADEAFPHDDLAACGYAAASHSEGRWNGVAVLVRDSLVAADPLLGLPGEPNTAEARWLEATVNGIRVVSVYVPNGRDPQHPMFAQKLEFIDAMRARVGQLVTAGPTVVAGDFNVAPTDRDVWDASALEGSTHVTPAERRGLTAVLREGLSDAYRQIDPDGDGFTWWDYRMGAFRRGWGMRIDLALVSEHLTVTSATVDTVFRRNNSAGVKPSDHAPLVIDLKPVG